MPVNYCIQSILDKATYMAIVLARISCSTMCTGPFFCWLIKYLAIFETIYSQLKQKKIRRSKMTFYSFLFYVEILGICWQCLNHYVLIEDTIYSERIIAWIPSVIYRFCVFFFLSKLAIRHIHLKQQILCTRIQSSFLFFFFRSLLVDWLLTCDYHW